MTTPVPRLAVLVLLVAWAGGAAGDDPPPPAPARLELAPCKIEGVAGEARCGTYEVWEDREARRGRRIPLKVVVLPASGPGRAPDPVLCLAGGPGESATSSWTGVASLEPLRRQRDLVFIDQRGTGGSNPLPCELWGNGGTELAALFPLDRVRACRAQLEPKADLRLYTTSIAVDDFTEVVRALGYRQVNLNGASYGTRVAQVYLRRHPETVRAMVLEKVVAMSERSPLATAASGHRALELLIADCAADAGCRAAFPRFREELDALLEALGRSPAAVAVSHPGTREKIEVRFGRPAAAEVVRFLLYRQRTARLLPLLVHRAHGGDLAPLAQMAVELRHAIQGELALGLLLSVTCAEDVPFIRPEEIGPATAGSFVGGERVHQQMAACGLWPRGQAPADFHEPVRSAVPALLLTGERDPTTPPAYGEEVVRHLPEGRLLVQRAAAHDVEGPCIESLIAEFLRRGSARDLDASCLDQAPPLPFALELPGEGAPGS